MAYKDSLYSEPSVLYGKNNTWRSPRDFHVKRVSVLSIFIATAYDILRFLVISEIKKTNQLRT